MKKVSLTAALYMIVLVMIFFFGCTKDDTVAPVINLSGENPLYIQLGDTWLDPGYTATDNKDGDITANVSVSHIPNPAEVNMYSVIYSVEDKAGNSTTITRKVYVSSDNLVGVYAVRDSVLGTNAGVYEYNLTISQSATSFNQIIIKNFRCYGEDVLVNATVTGSVITIPEQSPLSMPSGYEGKISGMATYQGAELKTMKYVTVFSAIGAGTDTCYSKLSKL